MTTSQHLHFGILEQSQVWILRALAQAPDAQVELYPISIMVPDALASDWEDAFLRDAQAELDRDIKEIDSVLEEHSGKENLSFWENEALFTSPKWAVIRVLAKTALMNRNLSLMAPHRATWVFT